ncbi:hypothetical protein HK107_05455 [Parvularcula sp. ZS-1/3]|uniref:Uncharacterized protein n=1 Tax=Parvularcula mediterranea TaxID=2732508 RepID=A0A7Y3RLF7_9PROT|nr:hypothetical protein [Parvularcula mediterranea]NNU15765.1 hypothetical protein [Parvularcula mediterranea]
MDIFHGAPIGVFGFVILIILIGSFFSFMKVRSNNETIKALAQSGQPIDPKLLAHLGREDGNSRGGMLVAGVIVLFVAAGLYFFGQQIGAATGDEEVGPVFLGIATLVGFVGGGLLLTGLALAVFRKKDDDA